MSQKRKQYGAEFKAKVALEAIREEATVAPLAQKHGIHPTLINQWKRQLLDQATEVFSRASRTPMTWPAPSPSCLGRSGRSRWNAIF